MNIYDSIIITGGGGMLGHAMADLLRNRGHSPFAFNRSELDISDESALAGKFESHRPTLLLNCAAHTKVDLCEQERTLADAINGYAVGAMARLSKQHGTVLVHVSTDFVFDGNLRRPYRVDDVVNPLSAYGASKLRGETELQKYAPARWLIARTAWVYGRHGANFPRTMVQAAQAGKNLKVVNDQTGSPTYAPDLAEAILNLLDSGAAGIWHVTNSDQTTWYDFAKATLEEFGIVKEIAPASSEEWAKIRPSSAIRPNYSVLDLAPYTKQVGKPPRHWREALKDFRAAVSREGF